MKIKTKIWIVVLCLLLAQNSVAQIETNLLPFSNKLLLNPAYAGLDENTNLRFGLQFHSISEKEAYNEFRFTYDKYSNKLKGGLAYYFQQGLLGDLNINTTEFGFGISRHLKVDEAVFIPSVNLNLQFASKQWFVNIMDFILAKEIEPPSPPGAQFSRYYKIKPRIGFLWDSPALQIGASAMFPFGKHVAEDENQTALNQPVFNLYITQKTRGKRRGLISEPFKALPEAALLYSGKTLLSRVGVRVEQTDIMYAFFIQNNFTENLHGAGASLGWKIENLQINFTAGMNLPVISDQFTVFGEATFSLTIPPSYYSEKNPWSPKKKLF